MGRPEGHGFAGSVCGRLDLVITTRISEVLFRPVGDPGTGVIRPKTERELNMHEHRIDIIRSICRNAKRQENGRLTAEPLDELIDFFSEELISVRDLYTVGGLRLVEQVVEAYRTETNLALQGLPAN